MKFEHSKTLPAVPKELLDTLEQRFPVSTVYPGYDPEAQMFAAGCRHVVDYIRMHSHQNASTGNPDAIR